MQTLTVSDTSDILETMSKQASRMNLKMYPEIHHKLKILAVHTNRTMLQVVEEHVNAELTRLGLDKQEQAKNEKSH